MQTSQRSTRKNILKGVPWFIAILAYGAVVTTLTHLEYGGDYGRIFRSNPLQLVFLVGAWVAMLVVPGGILLASKHKTAGSILVGTAILVTAFLFWLGGTLAIHLAP